MRDALISEMNQIQNLMEQRLKLTGTRQEVLRKSRRYLPYRHKRAAEALSGALDYLDNPRLAVTLDQARLQQQARHLRVYLSELDLSYRRRGVLLDIGATAGAALIAVIILLEVVLRWRGFV